MLGDDHPPSVVLKLYELMLTITAAPGVEPTRRVKKRFSIRHPIMQNDCAIRLDDVDCNSRHRISQVEPKHHLRVTILREVGLAHCDARVRAGCSKGESPSTVSGRAIQQTSPLGRRGRTHGLILIDPYSSSFGGREHTALAAKSRVDEAVAPDGLIE